MKIMIGLVFLSVLASAAAVQAKDTKETPKQDRTLPVVNEKAAGEQANARYWLTVLKSTGSLSSRQLAVQKLGEYLQQGAFSTNVDLGEDVIEAMTAQLNDGTDDGLRITALDTLREVVRGVRLTWYPEGGGQCLQGIPGKGTTKVLEGNCKIVIHILYVAQRPPKEPQPQLSYGVKIAWIPAAAALVVPDGDFATEFADGITRFTGDPDLNVRKAACEALAQLAKDNPKTVYKRCAKS